MDGTVHRGNDGTRFQCRLTHRRAPESGRSSKWTDRLCPSSSTFRPKGRIGCQQIRWKASLGTIYHQTFHKHGHIQCAIGREGGTGDFPEITSTIRAAAVRWSDPPPVRLTTTHAGVQEAIVAGGVGPGPLGAQGSPRVMPVASRASRFLSSFSILQQHSLSRDGNPIFTAAINLRSLILASVVAKSR